MKKAVIILDKGVQDEEYLYPYYRLQEANFHVDVAAPTKDKIFGKYGIPIRTTITTSEIKEKDYELCVIPGGWESPERIRQDKAALDFIRDMNKARKPIGAICHGPWVLISAQIVKQTHMTCYQGMRDDLINAGAIYEESSLVSHENIITAPHYRNNPEFMRALLAEYDRYLLSNLVLA
jgi:protease I